RPDPRCDPRCEQGIRDARRNRPEGRETAAAAPASDAPSPAPPARTLAPAPLHNGSEVAPDPRPGRPSRLTRQESPEPVVILPTSARGLARIRAWPRL